MKNEDKKLDAHLFICTNLRDKGESCGQKGSSDLRDRLKKISKDPDKKWRGHVRINNAGCLGHCEEGIVAVLYPEGKWFTGLKSDDVTPLERAVQHAVDQDKNKK